MVVSTSLQDPAVKSLTVGLVSYLREYLSKLQPNKVRDGLDRTNAFWLANVTQYVTAEGLELPCPPSDVPAPDLRATYSALDALRREAVNLSDTHELVLGVGLLSLGEHGHWAIRRHLLVCEVSVVVDPDTLTLHVAWPGTPSWKVEDREFLTSDDGFLSERRSIDLPESPAPDDTLEEWLTRWRQRSWATELVMDTKRWTPPENGASEVVELTLAPALLLRRRSQNGLLRMYDAIAAELGRPDSAAPAGLANLVAPSDAARPPDLPFSGLFPLPSNREQRRILQNLRTDSVVVVQGPPGTGKTHTIANLICSLLADGQRVLITSQKDQALRVLRGQLPPEIQQLCVLMTGMQGTGTDELDRSLITLSELLASADLTQLTSRIDRLGQRREEVLEEIHGLCTLLSAARLQEYLPHPTQGANQPPRTLTETAQLIVEGRSNHEWIDPLPYGAPAQPPLTDDEASELLRLLRTDSEERGRRRDQQIPGPDDLPAPREVAAAIQALEAGRQIVGVNADPDIWAVAELDDEALTEICGQVDRAARGLSGCGLGETIGAWDADDWRFDAIQALLRRRDVAYWSTLFDEAVAAATQDAAIAATAGREVEVQTGPGTTVRPRRLLHQALALRKYLSAGGRISRFLRPKPVLRASDLLSACTVDGDPPETAADLDAVIITLRAEIAIADAVEAWSETTARLGQGPLRRRLAQLKDIAATVTALRGLVSARDSIEQLLRRNRIRYSVGSPERWDLIVRVAHAVPQLRRARLAARRLAEFEDQVASWVQRYQAAPELALLLAASRDRDVDTFVSRSDQLAQARMDQQAGQRQLDLSQRLSKAHPALADALRADPHAPNWDLRLSDLDRAWTWGYAHQWYADHRDVDGEKIHERALDEAEQRLLAVTQELAGCQAVLQCVRRTSPAQRRALQEYRSAIASYGRGTSEYKDRYLRAAREAMDKGRAAVPAWVMPLAEVADNIPARPDVFDIVIVDEASQASVDSLFLLWLAPRIVVVGDEEQCTPHASTATDLGTAYAILDRHLPWLDTAERHNLGPNANLYELMSTRANETIRLTEHFRSMPEIIGWSSAEFYRDRLIPLRQFGADRLEPLKIVHVRGAEELYDKKALRNEAEAQAIVDQVEALIADPGNRERTIGVVVLQDCYQTQLIDAKLRAQISPADLEHFKIRVGGAPDFQGEERHIILLSLVATRKRTTLRSAGHRRRYNVAASRARDQLWLFTSMDMSTLDPTDLRHKLYHHMLDPRGHNRLYPVLDLAGRDDLRSPFESIIQQKIFVELTAHGCEVIPQYEIDDRRIDFLVAGERGRLAVECDGPSVPRTPEEIGEDIARERELRRCDWRIVRIRESEFILDPRAALRPLWEQLHERGIAPDNGAKED